MVAGGACSGQLQIGDTITQVNSVHITGKGPKEFQAVFEASCTSLGKVLLHIDRPGKCKQHISTKPHIDQCVGRYFTCFEVDASVVNM